MRNKIKNLIIPQQGSIGSPLRFKEPKVESKGFADYDLSQLRYPPSVCQLSISATVSSTCQHYRDHP